MNRNAEFEPGQEKYVTHAAPVPSGRRETFYREDQEDDPDYQEVGDPVADDQAVEAFVRSFTGPLSDD